MDKLLTANNLLLVALAVVPGFVANRVYALVHPSPRAEADKMLSETLTYSALNFLLWSWLILPPLLAPIETWPRWYVPVGGSVVCFVSPAGLALLWAWLRRTVLPRRLGFDRPEPRGWDYFVRRNPTFLVLFTLKGGKRMGGLFAGSSFAATYPQEPEIYVERVYQVDDDGAFIAEVPNTLGAVVRQSEWELIEFFEVKMEDGNERPERTSDARPGGTEPGPG